MVNKLHPTDQDINGLQENVGTRSLSYHITQIILSHRACSWWQARIPLRS